MNLEAFKAFPDKCNESDKKKIPSVVLFVNTVIPMDT